MVATLADAATADILFDTRSQKITVTAISEGMYKDFSVSAGADYVVLAWVKSDGTNDANVRIYDQTGSATVLTLTTISASYVMLTGGFEVPAGCSTIRVFIESGDNASYDIHCAQIQILPVLNSNPSMEGTYDDESGGGGGTIDVAPGWDNKNCETDGTNELSREAGIFHSGTYSQKIVASADVRGIATTANVIAAGKWCLISCWLYSSDGSIRVRDHSATLFNKVVSPGATWTHYSWVVKGDADRKLWIVSHSGGTHYVDDVSIVVLDDVSITATPASAANSAEGGGIRVDGLDTALQAPVTVTANKGKLNFYITKRHAAADVAKFGVTTPYELHWYEDANNYMYVYWSAANTLDLKYNAKGAGEQTGQANMTGAWTAGARKLTTLEWGASSCKLDLDGVNKITIAQPASFTAMTANFYFGSNKDGANQSDSVYGATS